MKTYKILVTTTLKKIYEVEAHNRNEAEDIVIDDLDSALDTDDINTELEHLGHN